jgi:pimeloyl-ACP methyl ester carboxylesterase
MKHTLLTLLLAATALAGTTTYNTRNVNGVNIFYREAGDPAKPTIVLLHGFPTSSHMFRDLIPQLAPSYHVIAPDFPGFGNTVAPANFQYTFANLADLTDAFLTDLKLTRYAIYVQDYGAPVGFRLFMKHPERIAAIVTQNGNAYDEGLAPFWAEYVYPLWKNPSDPAAIAKTRWVLTPEATRFQYTQGFRDPARNVSPDAWQHAQSILDRPGNDRIQIALFIDYQSNVKLYPSWHAALRKHQPAILAVWGKNDPIFAFPGAEAFRRDVPATEVHAINTGHFALEEEVDTIAPLILNFLNRNLKTNN